MPAIAARMPARSGLLVRPYALPAHSRVALILRLRRIAHARRHWLVWAGKVRPRGFDGRYGTARRSDDGWLIMPVHDYREARRARRHRADAVLISPVFPTRSHPGSAHLGISGFQRLAANSHATAIAMGGLDQTRATRIRYHGGNGWAGIDAWLTSADAIVKA